MGKSELKLEKNNNEGENVPSESSKLEFVVICNLLQNRLHVIIESCINCENVLIVLLGFTF